MSTEERILEPGWHPDPFHRHDWRYWDSDWTSHVADGGSPDEIAGADDEDEDENAEPTPEDGERELTHEELLASARAAIAVAPAPPPEEPAEKRRKSRYKDAPSHSVVPDTVARAGIPVFGGLSSSGLVNAQPINFGRAGLVVLSAVGIGVGARLPWLNGTIAGMPYRHTGFDLQDGRYFAAAAVGLAALALIAARFRLLRLLPIAGAAALFGWAVSELVDTFHAMHDLQRTRQLAHRRRSRDVAPRRSRRGLGPGGAATVVSHLGRKSLARGCRRLLS